MKKLQILITMLLTLMFMGCGDNPVKPKSKFEIKLAYANNALAKRVLTEDMLISANTEINLGNIEATKSFQFILVNNSSDSLTDVVITSSNPKFTPATMTLGTIGAPDLTDFYTMPLINITAVHGLAESRTGTLVDVMKTDESTTDITITGKLGGEPFPPVTYTMRVNPKFVSPEIITNYNNQNNIFKLKFNDESCDVKAKWLLSLDPLQTKDTVFHAGDIIDNISLEVTKKAYFTCVGDTKAIIGPDNTWYMKSVISEDLISPMY